MKLLIITFWFLYCLLQGWNDARIFAHGAGHYMKENQDYNIHTSFWLNRLLVGLFIIFVFLVTHLQLDLSLLALGLGMALTFSFLHEGAYYSSRKRIDNPAEYPNTHFELWLSYSSKSSTAKINFPGWSRVVMFFIGIFLLLIFLTP